MQFFATILSMAFAVAAVSAHEGETHYTNTTSVTPTTYGTGNTTSPSGTGAPIASATTFDGAAGKLSTSALGLLVIGGVVMVL